MEPTLRPAWAPGLEDIWRLVAARTGFEVAGIRRLQMEASLRGAMERAGFHDVAAYGTRLHTDADTLDGLIEQLLIGESYFFREPQQCRLLREVVLPERRQAAGLRARRALRVWSAGCAAGEEAYTLAILLDEADERDALLLATDISRSALAQARSARYRAWALRGLEPSIIQRWLVPAGDEFLVRDPLPGRVTFDRINLVTDEYPSLGSGVWSMDLIVCRNVLIYFDRQTVARVAEKLFDSLAPGGWLLAGSSDPPLQALAPFLVVERPEGIFYRRPDAAAGIAPAPPVAAPAPEMPAFLSALASLARPEPGLSLPAPAPPAPLPPPLAPLPDLAAVEARLRAGDYAEAAALAGAHPQQPEAWALRVRALANLRGPAEAALECERGLRLHGLSVELHYLMAALGLAQGRDAQALEEARRVLYLDRTLAVGHLLMGTLLRRLGDADAATRACRRAGELARGRGDGEPVPLGEGLTWGGLRALIERQEAR